MNTAAPCRDVLSLREHRQCAGAVRGRENAYAKTIWALLVDVFPGGAAGLGTRDSRQHQRRSFQDAQGVIPGANVESRISENGQTQSLVTNESGYFEAPLLQPGPYRVSVEMPNFKTLNQDVVLSVGQTLSVRLTLEVGQHHRERERHGRGADPRHDVGVIGTELRSRAHRGSADGGEPADPAREIRAGHHRPDHAAARASGADRRSERRRRRSRPAASAASTTRSTARPMPATTAAWRPRRTPTWFRRCASRRRTSTRRRVTAPAPTSR